VLRVPFDHRCDGGEGAVTHRILNCSRSGNLQTGTVLRPQGPGHTDSTLFIRFSKSHVCRCVSVPAPGWGLSSRVCCFWDSARSKRLMQRPDWIVFLALALAALVVSDLFKTLRTGRARSMWTGTFTREIEPQRFRRYVYGSYAVLMFCAGLVLWALIWPETF
jgi:hypothetical protein